MAKDCDGITGLGDEGNQVGQYGTNMAFTQETSRDNTFVSTGGDYGNLWIPAPNTISEPENASSYCGQYIGISTSNGTDGSPVTPAGFYTFTIVITNEETPNSIERFVNSISFTLEVKAADQQANNNPQSQYKVSITTNMPRVTSVTGYVYSPDEALKDEPTGTEITNTSNTYPYSATYQYGSVLQLAATPNKGVGANFTFDHWEVNGGSYFNDGSTNGIDEIFYVGGELEIKAIFVVQKENEFPTEGAETISDNSTINDYIKVLGINDNDVGARYAGRIYSDKSVYNYSDNQITGGGAQANIYDSTARSISQTYTGPDENGNFELTNWNNLGYGTVNFNSDFMEVFSAIGSSQILNGETPVNLSIVLDISGSMESPESHDKLDCYPTQNDFEDQGIGESEALTLSSQVLNNATATINYYIGKGQAYFDQLGENNELVEVSIKSGTDIPLTGVINIQGNVNSGQNISPVYYTQTENGASTYHLFDWNYYNNTLKDQPEKQSQYIAAFAEKQNHRMYDTIAAVNTFMKNFMNVNDNNQISVIAYDSSAYVLVPMGHYSLPENSDNFFTAEENHFQTQFNQWGCTVSFSGNTEEVETSESTPDQDAINNSVTSWSNTNLTAGIYAGLQELENASANLVDGTEVIPAMIALTDGAANATLCEPFTVQDDSKSIDISINAVTTGVQPIEISKETGINMNNEFDGFGTGCMDTISNSWTYSNIVQPTSTTFNQNSYGMKVYAAKTGHIYNVSSIPLLTQSLITISNMKSLVGEKYNGTLPMIYTMGCDIASYGDPYRTLAYTFINPNQCFFSEPPTT